MDEEALGPDSAMLPYPDDRTVNPASLSLFDTVDRCDELLNQDKDDFVRFILAGRERLGPGLLDTRAWTLNIEEDLEEMVPWLLTKRRDFDSLFGGTSDLPYCVPMTLWPLPPFRDTLTSETHIQAYAIRGDVSDKLRLVDDDD